MRSAGAFTIPDLKSADDASKAPATIRSAVAVGELLRADKRAFFAACSQASKAADYLRGLALAEPAESAA
jgi:antirestriction protein ArdC